MPKNSVSHPSPLFSCCQTRVGCVILHSKYVARHNSSLLSRQKSGFLERIMAFWLFRKALMT